MSPVHALVKSKRPVPGRTPSAGVSSMSKRPDAVMSATSRGYRQSNAEPGLDPQHPDMPLAGWRWWRGGVGRRLRCLGEYEGMPAAAFGDIAIPEGRESCRLQPAQVGGGPHHRIPSRPSSWSSRALATGVKDTHLPPTERAVMPPAGRTVLRDQRECARTEIRCVTAWGAHVSLLVSSRRK